MKKITFLIAFLIGLQMLNSQNINRIEIPAQSKANPNINDLMLNSSFKLDAEFFVLGTLSDYLGRFHYIDRKKQVDSYYPYEKPLAEYLSKYIQEEFHINVDTFFEKSNHCKMYSEVLSTKLNGYYDTHDNLIDSLFKSKKQICSFLTGVYYRYGEKIDSTIFKIQLSNSPKHQNCYELLKRTGCNKIFYKCLRNIPTQYILYFEPTKELEIYFNSIETEHLALRNSFSKEILEQMKKYRSEEEIKKDFGKYNNEELINIKNAFK